MMGLSARGLICRGETYVRVKEKTSETKDIIRQNKTLYLKKKRKCIVSLPIKENLNREVIPFWLKNQN